MFATADYTRPAEVRYCVVRWLEPREGGKRAVRHSVVVALKPGETPEARGRAYVAAHPDNQSGRLEFAGAELYPA